jgi:hypothetical protein
MGIQRYCLLEGTIRERRTQSSREEILQTTCRFDVQREERTEALLVEMKEIAKRQTSETKRIKKILLFHSSHFLARSLTRRCHGQQNSPLLALRVAPVLDSQRATVSGNHPNVLYGMDTKSYRCKSVRRGVLHSTHDLTDLADLFEYLQLS